MKRFVVEIPDNVPNLVLGLENGKGVMSEIICLPETDGCIVWNYDRHWHWADEEAK